MKGGSNWNRLFVTPNQLVTYLSCHHRPQDTPAHKMGNGPMTSFVLALSHMKTVKRQIVLLKQ